MISSWNLEGEGSTVMPIKTTLAPIYSLNNSLSDDLPPEFLNIPMAKPLELAI